MTDTIFLTKEGLEKLKKEYQELINIKLPGIIERVSRAREMGDLTENSDYQSACEEQSFMEDRINELSQVLYLAKIKKSKTKNKVDIGSKVMLHDGKKHHEFMLVGEWEADPVYKKISSRSPLGKALFGKKIGDKIEVEAPVGKIIYEVLKIE